MHEKLFSQIDALLPSTLDMLEDICNIESQTCDKAGVDAVCDYCVKFAEKHGFKTEIFPQSVSGNTALITMNPEATLPPITLSAHMDTVHPRGSFGSPATRRDSENMYAPGVMDCKGGIAASFLAMLALIGCGFDKRPIQLYLQSDEENSSATSNKETVKKMCEVAEGSVGFINLEGYVAPTAVLSRKGIIRYRFTVHGRAIHSARCAYGANAIAEAADKILSLEEMKDVGGLTCNCGVISGGTAVNTVAEKCTFLADIRFVNSEQLELAREKVIEIAKKTRIEGCYTELEEISFRPAMPLVERNVDFLEKINEIYEKCGLPLLSARDCVSGSDAAYITECGVPCVDCLGTEGGNIHSTREYARLTSLAESAKRIASVIYYI